MPLFLFVYIPQIQPLGCILGGVVLFARHPSRLQR